MTSITIVGHGDVDGLIGTACAVRHYTVPHQNTVITEPFLLDKLSLGGEIVVVDMAVNSRNEAMTESFILRHEILAWYDHHEGSGQLQAWLGTKACTGKSLSCVALMRHYGIEVSDEWLEAANAADSPNICKPTVLSGFLTRALKSCLCYSNESRSQVRRETQQAIIQMLLGNRNIKPWLESKADEYLSIERATLDAVRTSKEVVPNIALIKLETQMVDRTALCLELYKHFSVAVLQFFGERKQQMTLVATNREGLNLVQLFSLSSGSPMRITMRGDHQKDLQKIIQILTGVV